MTVIYCTLLNNSRININWVSSCLCVVYTIYFLDGIYIIRCLRSKFSAIFFSSARHNRKKTVLKENLEMYKRLAISVFSVKINGFVFRLKLSFSIPLWVSFFPIALVLRFFFFLNILPENWRINKNSVSWIVFYIFPNLWQHSFYTFNTLTSADVKSINFFSTLPNFLTFFLILLLNYRSYLSYEKKNI